MYENLLHIIIRGGTTTSRLWNFNQLSSAESTCKNSCQLQINSLATVFARSEVAATEYFMLAKEATIRERIQAFIWPTGTPENSLVASTVLFTFTNRTLP